MVLLFVFVDFAVNIINYREQLLAIHFLLLSTLMYYNVLALVIVITSNLT